MKRTRIISTTVAIACLFLLSSCANLVQEIVIHEDGSGILRFALGVDETLYPQFQDAVPEGFAFDNLLSGLMLDENVTNVIQNRYEENGQVWETIQLNIADFQAVFENGRRIGPGTITFNERDGVYRFTQMINLASSNVSIPGVNLLNLAGSGYSVRLVTPQIVGTNGLQTAAGISTWEVPLSELLQGGASVNLRSDYVLEPYEGTFIPWDVFFPYIVIGFLALGVISILVVIIINTVRKPEEGLKLQY